MTSDVNIVVGIKGNISGAKTIKRSLDDIDKSANKATNQTKKFDDQIKKTSNTARLFGRALGAIGGIIIVRTLGRMADEFTVLDTSIKNVTDTTQEYDRVFNSLFAIAQENGDVFSGLANTYQKLNVSLEDSVKNSIDLTKVTEILSRGFAASGTNAQTAAGASLQLTQGLATNFKAAGQELNSIIEGAPLLAKAIAIQLGGKGATDLKKFAEAGTLTAQSFLEALIAAEDMVKEFEIPSTIGRSIQRVRNQFLKLTGESETLRAISIGVGEGFDFVARNMATIFKVMAVGFGAFAGYILATKGVAAAFAIATTATATFNAVLLANPLGLFVAALAAVGVAAYVFKDDIYAALISPIAELILFVDEAIRKLREFKNFAVDGIAAASIGIQNKVGLIDDDIAQSALSELGGETKGFFDADALRAKAAGQVEALKNKDRPDPTNLFKPSGTGGGDGGGGSTSDAKKTAKELERIIKNTRSEQETLIARIDQLNSLQGFAKTATEVEAIDRALAVANQELLTASTNIPGLEDGFSKLRDSAQEFADTAGDAFGEIITGASSAKDAISNLLRSTASNLASEGFSGLVGGLLNGFGGKGGGILGGIGSLFGFNSGGDMMLGGNGGIDNNVLSLNGSPIANTSRGETMAIRPAGVGGNSGGGGVVVNQTINVSTGVSETVQAELVAFLPVIEQTVKAGVAADKQRGIS